MRASGTSINYTLVTSTERTSLHDSLLTRLSNDDDIEKNLSTFASEMATSAMILGAFEGPVSLRLLIC